MSLGFHMLFFWQPKQINAAAYDKVNTIYYNIEREIDENESVVQIVFVLVFC